MRQTRLTTTQTASQSDSWKLGTYHGSTAALRCASHGKNELPEHIVCLPRVAAINFDSGVRECQLEGFKFLLMKPSRCLTKMTELMRSWLSEHNEIGRTMSGAVVLLMTVLTSATTVDATDRMPHVTGPARSSIHASLVSSPRQFIDQATSPPARPFLTCRRRLRELISLLNDYRHR